MALNKFIPTSPDENIKTDSDMATAKFGHLNTIIDALNSGEVGGSKLALQTDNQITSGTYQPVTNGFGNSTTIVVSNKGFNNTGPNPLYDNWSTAIGDGALYNNLTAGESIAIGPNTLGTLTSGNGNIAIGSVAGAGLVSGQDNLYIGRYTGAATVTGNNNVGLGSRSLQLGACIGNHNVVIGGQDTYRYGCGSDNIVLGSSAMRNNFGTASRNVAIGPVSLYSSSVSCQVAIGYSSMQNNSSGYGNTAVGYYSMYNTSTGCGNTAMGSNVMLNNSNGCFNTASGYFAMVNNTTGSNNTVLGACASSGNFSGSVILGREAAATADNQFVVGSSTFNAGTVTTESNSSTKVWNVKINGVDHKILLA